MFISLLHTSDLQCPSRSKGNICTNKCDRSENSIIKCDREIKAKIS